MSELVNFSNLLGVIDDRLLKALNKLGFIRPTVIQMKALPSVLQRQDLIATANTGSGKTLAFLIPIIEQLITFKVTRKSGTNCIILSPTRELALQTFQVLEMLLTEIDLSYALIIGGEKKHAEELLLFQGANIVIATPGRLLDHLMNTKFKYHSLKCLVLDEADKLLEAGFKRFLTKIVGYLPRERQTILFSATIDKHVKNLARLTMKKNPLYISTKDQTESTVQGLKQGYCLCPLEQRMMWLFKFLKKTKKQKVMVFFSSCKSVDFHYDFFHNHCQGDVICIHGKQSQPKRKAAFLEFVSARFGVLLCTDIAARGLDIPAVDWIIQYDAPTDPKEYIHRVGRTARGLNGRGNAVILLRPEEENFVNYLHRENVPLDKYEFKESAQELQQMLEKLIATNGVFKTLARQAFLSFLRSYKNHPLKKVFDIKTIDLNAAAKAFGFLEPPHVDFIT